MTRLPNRRLSKVAAAVAIALGAPILVHGQAPNPELEEVTVTGSRIARPSGMDTPTPVTAVSTAELKQMSAGTLIESLSKLPQFFGNIGVDQIVGGQNSGSTNVNLRGVGVNRTLVLLDGRRVVASNRFGAVDVNMFPEALLKGTEIVTGGASASYGTDAVAGVVNFLLDTEMEGVKTHLQGGETTRWDGRNWEASIAAGHKFGEKLHVLASFGMTDQDSISSFGSLQDRRYFNQASRVTNPNPAGPLEIIRPYVAPTNFTNGGIIVEPTFPSINRLTFLPNGTTAPLAFSGVGSLNGGCQCYASPTQTYGVDSDTEVSNGYRRSNAFLYANYDLADSTKVFFQGIHGETRTSDRRESISLLSVWQARIYADNPYLPASLVNTIKTTLPANRQYFGFGFFGLDQPGTPLGDSRQITDNHMDSGTIGFKSDLGEKWNLDGYYQFGHNQQDFITVNGIRTDRLPLALDVATDASGKPVCRVSLPQFDPTGIFKGCVPVNLFGGLQNLTPEAVAWIRDDGKVARQWTKEHVVEIVLNGDLFEGWGAGAIGSAFGLSYRKDTLDQRTLDPSDEFPALPDGTLLSTLGIAPASLRGIVPQGESGGVPGYNGIPGLRFVPTGFKGDSNSSSVLFSSLRAIAGGYTVKEAFSEFRIPLLKDAAWAKALELSAAGRWASYSGSGSIWAWKGGASWAVNDQLRFRATESRDVRAATLQERFDQTRGGVNVQDPLNGNVTVTTASFSGGNPDVNPEKADTTTVGVVFRPSFIQNFEASLDWYRIDIADAIGQLTSQNVVTACANGDLSQCQYVHRRDGAPTGVIERVDNLFINLAKQKISGIDVETSWRHNLNLIGGGPESVTWHLYGTYLDHNSIQNKGGPVDERVGQVGPGLGTGALPRYKFASSVSYRNGPYQVFVLGSYIGHGTLDRLRVESTTNIPNSIDNNSVPSTFYTDLNLGYHGGKDENFEVYLNVTNVLDRHPLLTPGIIGRAGTSEFTPGLYDVIGRRFVLGVNYRL
jgi:outer membrane receptor protein involved in Fe transport